MQKIILEDISVDVVKKGIRNMHLSVHPPDGRVRISAPLRMDMDTIRTFVISKLHWIRKHQNRIKSQERETPREFINRESHYYMGKRYLLRVTEHKTLHKVELQHEFIEMYVRPDTGMEKREAILDEWYRQRLKDLIPELIAKHEKIMKVHVAEFFIKKMKTKWGTCNRTAKRIWLNLELAKKPVECIEYVVVHEMVHLFVRLHNDRFKAYMDKFFPGWRFYKEELNKGPLRHEDWGY
ncbi:MAG: M48 family metallopeptidase [Nitrospirae bacterium]|nr:M48 family metallopeptidase [Nitrospirota bacterium]